MRTARRRSAFTIIEVVLAVTVFSVILSGIVMMTGASGDMFEETSTNAVLDGRLRRTLSRIRQEVFGAGIGTLQPPDPTAPFGTSSLAFEGVTAVLEAGPVWGPTQRVRFEYAEGEIDNGLDDDGNGLIDEGVVVLTRNLGDANEKRVVLVRGVAELLEGEIQNGLDDDGNGLRDEPGLCFELRGGALIVRLTLQVLGPSGQLLVRTLQTSVFLRN